MRIRVLSAAVAIAAAGLLPLSASTALATPAAKAAAAPLTLQTIDTKVGTGKEAAAGTVVTVHYTGWIYSPKADKQHGVQFDSSQGRGPFSFPLGAGRVIQGWDQGVAGMKVGGKRTLIIPSALAYGDSGAGSKIPPGSNLIFDVELVGVR
ncbi:FKBP-type peptidyl-prolyl cis-trans isomerase [Undibacterium sp.]|jgi:FKBP-type peptidyl-prolyl cis-trans isomerase FkpA|uniref:FKBP-type peptidyl-prolyl cis-trans isomerase n=1 Tax=Undibacterium sp. TaxID=1914977 RepID=UPI002C0DC1FE|nr:FKBP-type peptidyl-prolyl cis-trans isomerase [Undibacterium sp.]HTD05461.1 FKBP-type peptidyl-prolyl cis-trans isomerase [Undibacterium sp.]